MVGRASLFPSEEAPLTLGSDVSVSIQTAAERAGVSVEQIHRWAAIEGLEIQRRGRLEIVRLDRVLALAAAARRYDPNSSRGALKARLADAAVESRGRLGGPSGVA